MQNSAHQEHLVLKQSDPDFFSVPGVSHCSCHNDALRAFGAVIATHLLSQKVGFAITH